MNVREIFVRGNPWDKQSVRYCEWFAFWVWSENIKTFSLSRYQFSFLSSGRQSTVYIWTNPKRLKSSSTPVVAAGMKWNHHQLMANIERVSSIKALGVTISSQLSMSGHVTTLLNSCASELYALRTLKAHGMRQDCLHKVFRSTVLAQLLYASRAWSGFCSAGDINKLDRFLNRCKSLNYCSQTTSHMLIYLMWQINLFLKPFYLIVIMFYIISYQKIKHQCITLGHVYTRATCCLLLSSCCLLPLTKLLSVCRPSVAGYKRIQVDRGINE